MKKLGILCGLLLLSGCQKETKKALECRMQNIQDENTVVQTITVNFTKDEVSNLNIQTETKLAEKYLEKIDVFEQGINSNFEEYVNKTGITVNSSKTENSVILNIFIDVTNIDEDMKKELGIVSTYSTYNDTKDNLEKSGYTCN